MDELIYTSATSLARAIRDKQVSSYEVLEAFLNRIEAVNPQLNAVVQLNAEPALTQAKAGRSCSCSWRDYRSIAWCSYHG